MTYLRCTACHQRFYTANSRYPILARCELCGHRLRTIERPECRPPALGPGGAHRPLPLERVSITRAVRGSYPDDEASFPCLIAFVRAHPARLHSRERDFGLLWRDGAAAYRAAWIEDTLELYIVQLGSPDQGGGHVRLLATDASLDQVESALTGWQDAISDSFSVNWLRERIRNHLDPYPHRTVQVA